MLDDVTRCLLEHARRDPRAPFLATPDRAPMCFGGVAEHIARVRERFARWGIERGDVVAVSTADRAIAAALLAVAPASATVSLYPDGLNARTCEELLRRMRTRAIIAPAGSEPGLVSAARALGIARIVATPGTEAGSFELTLDGGAPAPRPGPPAHPAHWCYVGITSGTTDRPKLVPYGHRQILRIARAMGEVLEIQSSDVSALVTPIHLANGQRTAFLLPVLHGASVACLPEARVDPLILALREDRVSFVTASFTFLRALLDRVGSQGAPRSRRLRFLRVASGALDPAEILALEDAFGVPVVTGLATTETGIVAHQRLPPARRQAGSVGAPLLAEMRLVDADGSDVAPGEVGEVLVRGPQVFDGYLDDDALEARSRIGAWFRLGDLARFDGAGDLFVVGRVKEIVNRGGDKIAPLEIDAALRSVPGVADAAAFGVPHPTLGEELVAAVVLEAGAMLDAGTIQESVRARLDARRTPRRVWFVDAVPRNRAGKILRAALPALVGFVAEPARFASAVETARAPFTAVLAALWRSVLGVREIRPDDDFRSLGGDDAKGAALVEQARAAFGVDLDSPTLDGGSATLAEMASALERASMAPGRAESNGGAPA